MDEKRLQKRYAQSLFDLAKDNSIIDTISDDIVFIYNTCKENREFEIVLRNPTVKPFKKREILLALFKERCNELTVKFLSLIALKRRDIFLRGICEEYLNIVNDYLNIKVATITVAQDMSENTKMLIKHKIQEECNCTVQLVIKKNTSLIGGFIIEMNGQQYDASFLQKINNLRRKIIK